MAVLRFINAVYVLETLMNVKRLTKSDKSNVDLRWYICSIFSKIVSWLIIYFRIFPESLKSLSRITSELPKVKAFLLN